MARQPADERPAAEPPLSEAPGFAVFAWVPDAFVDDFEPRSPFINMVVSR